MAEQKPTPYRIRVTTFTPPTFSNSKDDYCQTFEEAMDRFYHLCNTNIEGKYKPSISQEHGVTTMIVSEYNRGVTRTVELTIDWGRIVTRENYEVCIRVADSGIYVNQHVPFSGDYYEALAHFTQECKRKDCRNIRSRGGGGLIADNRGYIIEFKQSTL